MSEENKCVECGAYNGHSPECSLMSGDYAKSELKRYYKAWLEKDTQNRKMCAMYNERAQNKINKLRDERDKWKSKFMTVKNENNKLRKK